MQIGSQMFGVAGCFFDKFESLPFPRIVTRGHRVLFAQPAADGAALVVTQKTFETPPLGSPFLDFFSAGIASSTLTGITKS